MTQKSHYDWSDHRRQMRRRKKLLYEIQYVNHAIRIYMPSKPLLLFCFCVHFRSHSLSVYIKCSILAIFNEFHSNDDTSYRSDRGKRGMQHTHTHTKGSKKNYEPIGCVRLVKYGCEYTKHMLWRECGSLCSINSYHMIQIKRSLPHTPTTPPPRHIQLRIKWMWQGTTKKT